MKLILGAIGLFCFSFFATAQQPVVNENPVKVQIQLSPQQIAPGDRAELLIDVTVDAGHHAYKDMLKVKWPENDGVLIEKTDVSPVHDFDDPFTKKKREAIEGQSTVKATLKFPDNFPDGVYSKAVKFTYQACSATYCLFPKTIDLPVEFKVASKNTSVDLTGGSFSSALAHGTLWAYLFVFIAGILTSFTPCIFPMIPITISIIGARSAGTKRSRAFALSVFYVLGIATTYSTLGVVAASTGMLFGSLLGNIYVSIFIAAVFFLMALSMFGLFEIQAPAFVRNRLGTASTGTGFFGAYIAGLFAGIVASPCIGPVLVGILTYVAQTAQALFGFTLLFVFALGLGMIFIVLGTFTGLLSRLPKSGAWLNGPKYFFGVVFIGVGLYYLQPVFTQFLKPTNIVTGPVKVEKKPGLVWKEFKDKEFFKAFEQARLERKPIIIDFWAEWCAACHELEELTYTDPQVMEEGKRFELLKIDATTSNDFIKHMGDTYSIIGLPTVIFVSSEGEVLKDITVTGFVPGADFLGRMKKVK